MGTQQRHRKISEMRLEVEAWQRSGRSRQAWCAERGMGIHVLNYWIRRCAQSTEAASGFVEVVPPTGGGGSLGVYVRLLYPDGRVLEVCQREAVGLVKELWGW